jgi:multisubunit Na+/H+ antiporter MnhB subunit
VTPLVRLVSRTVLPVSLLVSMTYLIGAEEGPGDGFAAGIITSLGLTLEYLAYGYRAAHRQFVMIPYPRLIVLGLAVVLVATVLPLFTGGPVLGLQEVTQRVPVVGEVHLSRSMLFDVGIYLSVVGGAMTAIDHLRAGAP